MTQQKKLSKTRQMVLDRFTACLEKAPGTWRAQWVQKRPPQSGTGRKYSGINQLLLGYIASERGYQDPRWYTFNQIRKNGWHLENAKEQGVPVEYWSPFDKRDRKMVTWKERAKLLDSGERTEQDFIPYCKTYIVFNGDLIPELEPLPQKEGTLTPQQTNLLAERTMEAYFQNSGVSFHANDPAQQRAFYRPSEDAVYLPMRETFFSLGGYLATALHEITHSTGHESRLNRQITNAFGNDDYAKEELVAEIGSTLLCSDLGLSGDDLNISNHEAYVQGWISDLKSKPEILFQAINRAQEAADYVLEVAEVEQIRENIDLEQAKRYIEDYCRSEYDSEADFSSLAAVGLAYTTLFEEEIPIQVNANLQAFRIERFLDGKPLDVQQFSSLQEMNERCLSALDFDNLVFPIGIPGEMLAAFGVDLDQFDETEIAQKLSNGDDMEVGEKETISVPDTEAEEEDMEL